METIKCVKCHVFNAEDAQSICEFCMGFTPPDKYAWNQLAIEIDRLRGVIRELLKALKPLIYNVADKDVLEVEAAIEAAEREVVE